MHPGASPQGVPGWTSPYQLLLWTGRATEVAVGAQAAMAQCGHGWVCWMVMATVQEPKAGVFFRAGSLLLLAPMTSACHIMCLH